MKQAHFFRNSCILAVLSVGVCWNLYVAYSQIEEETYPNAQFAATPAWLTRHSDDENLVLVDVRTDEHFDGAVIPGAIRLPWNVFRHDDLTRSLASVFVGVRKATAVLGEHGIARSDTVVLYDSVERDGGATASYVFWVLDLLGHKEKRVLDGGIDAWIAGGGETGQPVKREPVLYQAPGDELRLRSLVDGKGVYERLGDPYYQFLDVRSEAEYIGEKGTKGLTGQPLKPGHIPTAYNVNYEMAWNDPQTKKLKSYPALQELYRGLAPEHAVIVYCNSGRRSSYGYYVLRLMGFNDVRTYEASWKEWGRPQAFFPVETEKHPLQGTPPAGKGDNQRMSASDPLQGAGVSDKSPPAKASSGGSEPSGGYVSCGG